MQHGGVVYYDVLWDDGRSEIKSEFEITAEVLVQTAWDLLVNNSIGQYQNFNIANTLHKIRNTTTNTISTLKASRIKFLPYQFKPLIKFLQSQNRRILIADEVGLGKTIEAGNIMLEMAARKMLGRALVICPNSLTNKWYVDMLDKFNLRFKNYDKGKDFLDDLKKDAEESSPYFFAILNYEKCRISGDEIIEILKEHDYRFDMVVCDEAHRIRNSETATHKSIKTIIDHSNAVIFLTATPIMTDIENLYSLVKILEPTVFSDYRLFQTAIEYNRPFIRAISQLRNGVLPCEVANALENSIVTTSITIGSLEHTKSESIGTIFQDDRLFCRVIEGLKSSDINLERRIGIERDLIELNSLNHIYSRTRKVDVEIEREQRVIREPRVYFINLTDSERDLFNNIMDDYGIASLQKKRQISSSIIAYHSTRENLRIGNYNPICKDSKFEIFMKIIDEVVIRNNKRILVFSSFPNTLLYLKIKLDENNLASHLIYGDVNTKERLEMWRDFENNSDRLIFLSSEVGSEGIDVQYCDALVNYDLPWNPMVVEQRIGRLDRIGQKSKVINIYNLVIEDSIEAKIYRRLYERINLFRETIGDLEEILGTEVRNNIEDNFGNKLENKIAELYRQRMTDEQIESVNKQLVEAANRQRLDINEVKERMQDAFSNDIYFQNEISSIEKGKRYLTEEEIKSFVESIIRIELTAIHLRKVYKNEHLFYLDIPPNSISLLFDFIEKYKDSELESPDLHRVYKTFKRKFEDKKRIEVTFNQSYAFENKGVEYISAYHPLINASTNYFAQQQFAQNLAFKIGLSRSKIDESLKVDNGIYLLVVYKISVQKCLGEEKQNEYHFLKNMILDLNSQSPAFLTSEVSDHIFGLCQMSPEPFTLEIAVTSNDVATLRPIVSLAIKSMEDQIREDEQIKFESLNERRVKQEIDYLNIKIAHTQNLIRDKRGLVAIQESEIQKLNEAKRSFENKLGKATVYTSNHLISVNLLQIL